MAVNQYRQIVGPGHQGRTRIRMGGTVLHILKQERRTHQTPEPGGRGGNLCIGKIGPGFDTTDITCRVPDPYQQAARFIFSCCEHALAVYIIQLKVSHTHGMLTGGCRQIGDRKQPERCYRRGHQQGEQRSRQPRRARSRFRPAQAVQQQHQQRQARHRHTCHGLPAVVQHTGGTTE